MIECLCLFPKKKLLQLEKWDFRGLTREDIVTILNMWQRET